MMRLLGFVLTIGFVLLSYSSSQSVDEYKQAVTKTVEKKLKDLKSCFKGLKDEKGKPLQGKLILSWEIDEKGKPRDVSRSGGTLDNLEAFHCIQKKILKLKFSKPPQDRPVDYEREFHF